MNAQGQKKKNNFQMLVFRRLKIILYVRLLLNYDVIFDVIKQTPPNDFMMVISSLTYGQGHRYH